jgi:hypothetical protein
MDTTNKYDQYPVWIVLITNLFSLLVYGLGFLIMFSWTWLAAILYLAFVIILELRVIMFHCVDCIYWGRTCGFGKGRISAWFFKKGDPSKFCSKSMTWKDMIPDFLVTLIPIITGIVLLVINFNLIVLLSIIGLIFLTTVGNSYVRGSLTCIFCKQKDIGCPADQLFNKNNNKE